VIGLYVVVSVLVVAVNLKAVRFWL